MAAHPFTLIKVGNLVAITGWAIDIKTAAFHEHVINFPIEGMEEHCSLYHGETVVGLVVKKYKQKQKQFIQVLIKDRIILIERGWVNKTNFAIGKIVSNS